jgi:hypothetical protein
MSANPEDIVAGWDAELARYSVADGVEHFRRFMREYGLGADPTAAAQSLRAVGQAFENAGRAQEAVAAYEEVQRRFGDNPSGELVEHVIASLVRRADVLGQLGSGVHVVRDLCDLAVSYGDDSSEETVQAWRVLAVYDKAAAFCAEGLRERDLAAVMVGVTFYDELDARFRSMPFPSVQEWVAKGRYNKADALATINQIAPARAAFEDVVRRFGTSTNETLREVAAYAALRAQMLIELPPPPSGLHPSERAWRAEMIRDRHATDDPKLAAYLDRKLVELDEFSAGREEAMRAQHERAVEVLVAYMTFGEPFALLLRNFDLEGFFREYAAPEHLQDLGRTITFSPAAVRPTRLEQFVASEIADRVPVVSAGNVRSIGSHLTHVLPSVVLPDERWKTIIDQLVTTASFILMDADWLSPGVAYELALVRRHHRELDTVVVLPSAHPDSSERFLEQTFRVGGEYYSAPQSEYEPLEEGHPALAGFTRIVSEDELVEKEIESSPLVADLVARARALAALDPEARIRLLLRSAPNFTIVAP